MDRPNWKSIPLSKPTDRRAGHSNPFREIIQIDNRWHLARKSGSIFPFSLAQDCNRHTGLTCFVIKV